MYKSLKRFKHYIIIGLLSFVAIGCGVKYGFRGGSIPEGMNTYTVLYFENLAPLVYTPLSQNFTEGLKEIIRRQSRLSQVNNDGDATFEGVITGYTIGPSGPISGVSDRSENSRLTITVKVKYTNKLDPTGESDFEQTFSQFKDFPGADVTRYEASINAEIIKMLTEDIFNKAFDNWDK